MYQGIHHVSFSVSDMNRTKDFYVNVMGFTVIADFILDDRAVDDIVQLEDSRLHVVMLQVTSDPGHPLIEMICYENPKGEPLPDGFRYNNVGCTHLAFTVDDVDAEYERLKAAGVVFNCEPKRVVAGELGAVKATYFRDPDGITLEIVGPAD